MRDYLYIWHNSEGHFIVASGIEFKDLIHHISESSGLILLNHQADDTHFDKDSRFDYIKKSEVCELFDENIYSWGDFCWVDYNCDDFPEISKKEIAELLYFAHKVEPYGKIQFGSLNNRFLYYAHDDSWFTKLYYKNWSDIDSLVKSIPLSFDKEKILESLLHDKCALWIHENSVEIEEATFDIDAILNRRVKAPTKAYSGAQKASAR